MSARVCRRFGGTRKCSPGSALSSNPKAALLARILHAALHARNRSQWRTAALKVSTLHGPITFYTFSDA